MNHRWSQRFGGVLEDAGRDIAVDGSGNIVMTGWFRGTVDFGGGPFVGAGVTDIFVAKYDALGAHVWSQGFGDAGTQVGYGIAVDGSDNVLVTGYFEGTVDFGGGPLVSGGSYDAFLAKYDDAGNHVWSRRFGGGGSDRALDVAVDGLDNVLVTGAFRDTVDFGGGPLISRGTDDIFLAKYNSVGDHLWSVRFGSVGFDQGWGVAVDGSDNVLLAGTFRDTVDFGGGTLASNGSDDIVIAKYLAGSYDRIGSFIHQPDTTGWNAPTSKTPSDSLSFPTSSGTYTGTMDRTVRFRALDNGRVGVTPQIRLRYEIQYEEYLSGMVNVGSGYVPNDPVPCIFVNQLVFPPDTVDLGLNLHFAPGLVDSNGVMAIDLESFKGFQWSQRYGGAGSDTPLGVTVDGTGNILMTGSFQDTVDFGGGALVSAGGYDIFVAKIDSMAAHVWSQRFGDTDHQRGASIAVDRWDGVLVTGYFEGTVDFGGGPLGSGGSYDIFLARYSSDGVHTWSQRFGDIGWDEGLAVDADASGNIFLAGQFEGTVDFGGGPLTSVDDADILLASYADELVAVAVTSFNAKATTFGVELQGSFRSDLDILGINIYRGDVSSPGLRLLETLRVHGADFAYEDRRVKPGHTYRYQIGVVDGDGEFFSQTVTVNTPSYETALLQNVPNPFNPATHIGYTVDREGAVHLGIYDIAGRLVRTLVDQGMPAGAHSVEWDGRDNGGRAVASGIYLYRLTVGKRSLARKAVLLK